MKIKTRKRSRVFFGLIVILLSALCSSGNTNHDASEISVVINGKIMSLQRAFDGGCLKDGASCSEEETSIGSKYHNASDIIIASGKDLQESIDENKLCRDSFEVIFGFHSVDDIIFEDRESLGDKIDSQKFCSSYRWDIGEWSELKRSESVAICPKPHDSLCFFRERGVNCVRSDGKIVKDSFCDDYYLDFCRATSCADSCDTSCVDSCKYDSSIASCIINCRSSCMASCTIGCEGKPEFRDFVDAPFRLFYIICFPRYTEHKWIQNPFKNEEMRLRYLKTDPIMTNLKDEDYEYIKNKKYAWFDCAWDLPIIRCGRFNDGCMAWFSDEKIVGRAYSNCEADTNLRYIRLGNAGGYSTACPGEYGAYSTFETYYLVGCQHGREVSCTNVNCSLPFHHACFCQNLPGVCSNLI